MSSHGILKKYGKFIELPSHAVPLSLSEGDTSLILVPKLAREIGADFEEVSAAL